MHSTDMELMVKQANIIGRLARGSIGAIKGAPKGALIGGTLGMLAAPLGGAGLAAALGVGGAGAFSGAMMGGGLRGAIGGLRGLLKNPNAGQLPKHLRQAAANQQAAFRAGSALPAVGVGGGLGYMMSDEDNKLMGTTLGVVGGLMARPAVMRAIKNRRAM
jgi:hypothetical protein